MNPELNNPPHSRRPRFTLMLMGVLVLGVLLRFPLLDYGLPLLLHEDEPIYFYRALNWVAAGDWNLDYFNKPGFFLYSYGLVYGALFQVEQWLSGGGATWAELLEQFWQYPTPVVTAGRGFTLTFAIGTLWLTYRLGKELAVSWLKSVYADNTPEHTEMRYRLSRWVGIVLALMMALHPTHVRYSTTVISDIPSLFFLLLTAWLSLRLYRKGGWAAYLVTASALALTVSYKYNIFAVVFPFMAHSLWVLKQDAQAPASMWARCWRVFCSPLLWGCALWTVGLFLALNPATVMGWEQFVADLDHERRHMLFREDYATTASIGPFWQQWVPTFQSADTILFKILPRQLGWPLFVAACTGWVTLGLSLLGQSRHVRHKYPAFAQAFEGLWAPSLAIVMSFPLVFLWVTAQFETINAKYLLPLAPFWGLAAMIGVVLAWSLLLRLIPLRVKHPRILLFMGTLTTLLLSSTIMLDKSVEIVSRYENPDTRTLAYRWMSTQLEGLPQRSLLPQETRPSVLVLMEPDTFNLDNRSAGTYNPQTPQLTELQPVNSGENRRPGIRVLQQPLKQASDAFFEPTPDVLSGRFPDWVVMDPHPHKVENPASPAGEKIAKMSQPSRYYQTLRQHYQPCAILHPDFGYIDLGQPVQPSSESLKEMSFQERDAQQIQAWFPSRGQSGQNTRWVSLYEQLSDLKNAYRRGELLQGHSPRDYPGPMLIIWQRRLP